MSELCKMVYQHYLCNMTDIQKLVSSSLLCIITGVSNVKLVS